MRYLNVNKLYSVGTDGKNTEINYNVFHNTHSDNPETWWGASGIYLDKLIAPQKRPNGFKRKRIFVQKKSICRPKSIAFFLPRKDSLLIDAGGVIEDLKDIPYTGKSPDVGAYEYGLSQWTTGSRCRFEEEIIPDKKY